MTCEENILVCVNTVAVLLRKRVDTVYDMADGGTPEDGRLTWVFNVSARGHGAIRDLRFFMGEVIAPEHAGRLTLARVIDCSLPPHIQNFHSGRVERLFGLRKQSLMRLRRQMGGDRNFNTSYFPRAKLPQFLETRWLGATPVRAERVDPEKKPVGRPRIKKPRRQYYPGGKRRGPRWNKKWGKREPLEAK